MKNIRETMPRLHSAIVSYFSGVASRIPQENIDDRNMIVQLAKKGKYDLAHLLCVRDKVAPKQYRGYDYFPVKLFSQNIEQRINSVEDKNNSLNKALNRAESNVYHKASQIKRSKRLTKHFCVFREGVK